MLFFYSENVRNALFFVVKPGFNQCENNIQKNTFSCFLHCWCNDKISGLSSFKFALRLGILIGYWINASKMYCGNIFGIYPNYIATSVCTVYECNAVFLVGQRRFHLSLSLTPALVTKRKRARLHARLACKTQTSRRWGRRRDASYRCVLVAHLASRRAHSDFAVFAYGSRFCFHVRYNNNSGYWRTIYNKFFVRVYTNKQSTLRSSGHNANSGPVDTINTRRINGLITCCWTTTTCTLKGNILR